SYSTATNTLLTVSASGVRSNDGTPLLDYTAVKASSPSHGTLTFSSDGGFTYKPTQNYSGTDSFTYYDKDQYGNQSNTATVTINVGGAAAPTVTGPDAQSAVEGASQSFDLGRFTSNLIGTFSLDINWGDGSPDTKFQMSTTTTGTTIISPQSH